MRRLIINTLLLIFLIFLVVTIVALVMPGATYRSFFESDRPMVIAHQGGEGLRPSNTLASFDNAVELGADVLEMDVHSTRDGVLVVIHDDTVDRTTDGSGRVQDMTFQEIQQLDAGYYWTEDGQSYPFRGQGIQIPPLESVLAAHPQMKFNIEIKQQTPSIAAPLCNLIRTYDLTDRTLVASFHKMSMDEFRTACPDVATSMVESEIRLFYVLNRLFLGGLFNPPGQAFQVPEYSGDLLVLSPRFIIGAHARDIAIHPWTINDPIEMQRFLDMEVDGIITDRPDLMLELLGN